MSKTAKIKEQNIRPEPLMERFRDLCKLDAETFFELQKMQHVSCPDCGAKTSDETGFSKYGFTYKNCSFCDSIYASPRPSQGELNRYYHKPSSQRYWSEVVLQQTQHSRLEQIVRPALMRV